MSTSSNNFVVNQQFDASFAGQNDSSSQIFRPRTDSLGNSTCGGPGGGGKETEGGSSSSISAGQVLDSGPRRPSVNDIDKNL